MDSFTRLKCGRCFTHDREEGLLCKDCEAETTKRFFRAGEIDYFLSISWMDPNIDVDSLSSELEGLIEIEGLSIRDVKRSREIYEAQRPVPTITYS